MQEVQAGRRERRLTETLRKQGLLKRSSLNGQNIVTKFRFDIFDPIECFCEYM